MSANTGNTSCAARSSLAPCFSTKYSNVCAEKSAEAIMTEFKGKIALVTGTSGIGLASAMRLAASGATVLACGNDASTNEGFDRIAREQDLPMSTLLTDVSVEAE